METWLIFGKDLIVGLAWPSVAITALLMFRRPVESVVAALAMRVQQALNEIELPGGIRATFQEEREQTIEAEAEKLLAAVTASLPSPPPEAMKAAVRTYVRNKELQDFILRLIGSRGVLSQGLVYDKVRNAFSATGLEEVTAAIELLVNDNLVVRTNGSLQLTQGGVERYRSNVYYS